MIYKNSMKLLSSNFSLVWKHLAYTLIRLAIIIGLVLLVSHPIVKLLRLEGFAYSLKVIGENLYTNFPAFFSSIKNAVLIFCDIIYAHMSQVWYSVILFFICIFGVNTFLKNAGKYVLSFVAHNKFTSLSKCGYMHTFITKFKDIFAYSAGRLIIDFPFMALKLLYFIAYIMVLDNLILSFVGISILIIVGTITSAAQFSLCHNFAAEKIINGNGAIKSVTSAFNNGKDYWRVFSNGIIVVLTIIVVNAVIGVFTVGAGLLITVPASMVLSVIYELVSYYCVRNQRYYLSPSIIVDTNKLN